jgi:hypothetical protein
METLLKCCAGLDVHQASVSACAGTDEREGRHEFNERFGTTTPDLLALTDWLRGHGVIACSDGRDPASIGTASTTRSRVSLSCCSSTPPTSSRCRDARPTPRTRPSSANCWSAGFCGRASCRRSRSASCATSPAIARR